jgi:hypothetical protein
MITIKDDHDFLQRAMKAYDNPSAISIEEFNKDLYLLVNIKKFIRKYHSKEEVNVRRLVNYFVVFYNCFGSDATDLLFYKMPEKEFRAIAIPIMSFLGHATSDIPDDDINTSIIQDLIEL